MYELIGRGWEMPSFESLDVLRPRKVVRRFGFVPIPYTDGLNDLAALTAAGLACFTNP